MMQSWAPSSRVSRGTAPRARRPGRATTKRCGPCGTGAREAGMTEPDTTGVLDSVTSPALNEGWIRAVLFDHAIDDWVDLGPDPIRRRHAGQIYADHVGAAYAAWKRRCDRAGTDVESPPAAKPVPEALALEVGVQSWTELM